MGGKDPRPVDAVSLEVYVEQGCMTCRRSLALAEEMRRRFPQLSVKVVDVASGDGRHRDLVTAVPTFFLNGARFALGNPSRADLERAIRHALVRQNNRESQV